MKALYVHSGFALISAAVLLWLTPLQVTAANLVFFSIIFFLAVWPFSILYSVNYFLKIPKLVNLFLFFGKELIIANFKVAYDVITPPIYMRPCIIELPLDAKSDFEITVLANMISLTPGTLSLDVSADKKSLFVHVIYFTEKEVEHIKENIKNGFERRILEVTR